MLRNPVLYLGGFPNTLDSGELVSLDRKVMIIVNVGQILMVDSSNGLGIRLSVFVSGCTNRCKGCFQPQTWDFSFGKPYDDAMEQFIIDELSKNYYDGLTILGGEPFELENQHSVAALIRRVKQELPEKNIWVYTGFSYDTDLQPSGKRYIKDTDEILGSIDVLVDGKFIEEQKDVSLNFRGSKNQRIIDVQSTRKQGEIVILPL